MDTYGEWAEGELNLFLKIVRTGDIVLDVGANIGAFTVPLAKRVGMSGRVYAFEPQRIINQRLNANVALNNLPNVFVYHAAVGSYTGTINVPCVDYSVHANFASVSLADPTQYIGMPAEEVPLLTLDTLKFARLDGSAACPSFIKVDVELMEDQVLLGAQALLLRCRPVLYLENPCLKLSPPLISLLYSLSYTPYWDVQQTRSRAQQDLAIQSTDQDGDAINVIGVPNNRLRDNSDDEAGGDIAMIGYTLVEPGKPYLHEYFGGKFRQAGDEASCGDGGAQYSME
jgi:FkbM family methyltransferase